jgi:hypothetical protein
MGKNRNSKSWTFFLPAVLFSAAAVLILLAGCEKSLLRLSIEDMAGYLGSYEEINFDFPIYDYDSTDYYEHEETYNFGQLDAGYISKDFVIYNQTGSDLTVSYISVSDTDSDTNFYVYTDLWGWNPPDAIAPEDWRELTVEFYSDGGNATETGSLLIYFDEYGGSFELHLEGYTGYSGSC